MKTLKMVIPLLAAMAGCDGGTPAGQDMAMAGGDMAMAGGDMATAPDMAMMMIPPAPMLGAQIDRMGRPGVNTALTDPFDTVMGMTEDQVKDAYNAEADATMWRMKFAGYIRTNLAIFDGADTVCGNQAAADLAMPRYSALAGVLADDVLLVNTKNSTCMAYLGVEVAALGTPNMDCGGRTPNEDVIDVTYSVVTGAMPGVVTDGVAKDGDGTHSLTAFPFLDKPL